MAYVNMKPSEILSKEQIVALKEKKDWKNVVSIVSNWSQIVIAIALFYIFPHWATFLMALIVIGSRQFALAVLVHEGAHNLLFQVF